MTINVALLKQTLAHIEAHPDEWNQADYRCGSGMCVAGWAAQFAGGKWYADDPDAGFGDALIAEPDEPNSFRMDDVRLVYADHRAQRVLGLDGEQADRLFEGSNSLPDLRRIVAELVEEAAA
ncbi:hypothetical protein AB0I81_22435 [Nonomuraea sp. NPDC050404]|uniref:hypothetical protein n=1 Tax=Nonomuraea sp. NPDC050404 TaxID=3155783 RepID=UPI0033E21DA7